MRDRVVGRPAVPVVAVRAAVVERRLPAEAVPPAGVLLRRAVGAAVAAVAPEDRAMPVLAAAVGLAARILAGHQAGMPAAAHAKVG